MRGRVFVEEGETIEQALKRLRRQVCSDRELDKWPVWAGHHATENQQDRRARWLRDRKRKWNRIWGEKHRKQLAKTKRN